MPKAKLSIEAGRAGGQAEMVAHPTSDDEKNALSLAVAEGRIARLRGRIAKLKDGNRPTQVYEDLLAALEESLEIRSSVMTAPAATTAVT